MEKLTFAAHKSNQMEHRQRFCKELEIYCRGMVADAVFELREQPCNSIKKPNSIVEDDGCIPPSLNVDKRWAIEKCAEMMLKSEKNVE